MAALSLVMMVSAVISALALTWQLGEARARLANEAQAVAAAVAARGFALHHWLYEDANVGSRLPGGIPAVGAARMLTAAELTAMERHAAFAPWHAVPRGWEIEPLVSVPEGQGGQTLPHGVVVLTLPPTVATDSAATRAVLERLREETRSLLAGTSGGRATDMARAAPGFGFDPAEQIAMFAMEFSGLNHQAVLRFPRPSARSPGMNTDLDFAPDAGVINTARIAVRDLETAQISPLTVGDRIRFADELSITGDDGTSLLTADVVTVRAPVTVDGPLITETMTQTGLDAREDGIVVCTRQDPDDPTSVCMGGDIISSVLVAQRLSVCRPQGNGCSGGDLDASEVTEHSVINLNLLTVVGLARLADGWGFSIESSAGSLEDAAISNAYVSEDVIVGDCRGGC